MRLTRDRDRNGDRVSMNIDLSLFLSLRKAECRRKQLDGLRRGRGAKRTYWSHESEQLHEYDLL